MDLPKLPTGVVRRRTSSAGTGLFASETIKAGEEILRVQRPYALAVDSDRLHDTCASCCLFLSSEETIQQIAQEDDDRERRLSFCLGCKIVKYCSKACQKQDWDPYHKSECKIFRALYPRVLPNTVRAIFRFLLLRARGSLPDEEWDAFLSLRAHVDEFRNMKPRDPSKPVAWENFQLVAQAAKTYSGTTESLESVHAMVARFMINSHTLTTPTLDPLGLCLTTTSALLNHSCNPNAYVLFSGPSLHVRASHDIMPDQEITIAYIDTAQATKYRQIQLQGRYFFKCTCKNCSTRTHCGDSMKPDSDQYDDPAFQKAELRVIEIDSKVNEIRESLDETSTTVLQAQKRYEAAANRLEAALKVMKPYSPYLVIPYRIRHDLFLNALASYDWFAALHHSLKSYFYIDPIHFPSSSPNSIRCHPARLVRKWTLLRQIVTYGSMATEGPDGPFWRHAVSQIEKYALEWSVVIGALFEEVWDGVKVSHGPDNVFTHEVKRFGKGLGIFGAGGEEGTRLKLKSKDVQKEWNKLRKIADQGL